MRRQRGVHLIYAIYGRTDNTWFDINPASTKL